MLREKSSHAKRKKGLPADKVEPTFDLSALLGYRLNKLSTSIGNLANRKAMEAADLSLPEYRVLAVLHSRGPSGVVALQQAMLIDKAWISRTLTGLVEKALVASGADSNDARRTVYSVSASGKRAAKALIEQAVLRQQRILQGLDAAEIQMLFSLLGKVQANVDQETIEGLSLKEAPKKRVKP
jgi:DNA-binding MarR family transcriptional regulator